MAGIKDSTGYEIYISVPTYHQQAGRVLTPDIIGMTESNAATAITTVGLVKGVVTLTTGVVTRQNPLGGTWNLDGNAVAMTLTS
jgi:predicted benzoate:H+ symporter BenE